MQAEQNAPGETAGGDEIAKGNALLKLFKAAEKLYAAEVTRHV